MTWKIKRIGEVCDVVAGQSPQGRFYNTEQKGLPFYQGKKEFGEKYIQPATVWTSDVTKTASNGDILMSVRAPVGPINVATEEICIGRGLASIRAHDTIDREFLYYQLLHLQPTISGNQGAVFASISKSYIEALGIVVPTLPEQRRIVAILDEVFLGIATAKANTERSRCNIREVFGSASQQILDLANGNMHSLEGVAAEDCSLSYGIVQPGSDMESGIPVVRPVDLTREVITLDGLKRIDPELAKGYQRTSLQGGELLLCVRGTTGTVSIAGPDLKGANVTRGIVPIRFRPELVAAAFGNHLMRSASVQSQIREKTYGAALMQINIGDLRNISLKIPPLAKQQQISSQLDALRREVQSLESLYTRKLAALDKLRQSLLEQAFAGKL